MIGCDYMRKLNHIIRGYVERRDENKCRLCGKVIYGEKHIHHLYHRNSFIPSCLGVPGNSINHPQNLIILCPECHLKVHSRSWKDITNGAMVYPPFAVKDNQRRENNYPVPDSILKILEEGEGYVSKNK